MYKVSEGVSGKIHKKSTKLENVLVDLRILRNRGYVVFIYKYLGKGMWKKLTEKDLKSTQQKINKQIMKEFKNM